MLVRSRTIYSTNHIIRSHFIYTCILYTLFVVVDRPAINQVTSSPMPTSKPQARSREPISLEEAFLGELRAKDFEYEWSSSKGGENSATYDQIVYEESKNIQLTTLPRVELDNDSNATGPIKIRPSGRFKPSTTVLVANSSVLSSIEFQGYKVSPSKRYLLLWNSKRKQFRHSFTAKYFLYDIEKELIAILSTRDQIQAAALDGLTPDEESENTRFQLADWFSIESPTGLIESLILIQNNDIFTLHDVSRLIDNRGLLPPETKGPLPVFAAFARPRRLTYTGRDGVIFNGVPDWLYEEEIMGDAPAFQVSPSSNHLAYMTFNDSRVNIMPISIYGDRVIPRVQLIRYPKAGRPNPQVSVHIVENFVQPKFNLGSRVASDLRLTLPEDLEKDQHYINRICWLTNEKLALIWSSRNQSNSVVVVCSMHTSDAISPDRWKCEKSLEMKADNGWLEINDDVVPLNDDHYLALIPKFEGSDVGYFKHIAKVSLTKPNSFVFITRGRRDVISINTVDYRRSVVYYTSTPNNKPSQRQLYVANLNNPKSGFDDNQSTDDDCITCDNYPDECTYNYVKMSPSANYYMYHCSGPGIPRTELRSTRGQKQRNFFENLVNDTRLQKLLGRFNSQSSSHGSVASGDSSDDRSSSSLLLTFEENEKLKDKLMSQKIMPSTMRFNVQIHGTKYLAHVQLLIPQQLANSLNSSRLRQAKTGNISLAQANELLAPLKSDGRKFPMVLDVYGGPGSQKVDDRFGITFGHYLASSEQMIYAMIDGRGSGYEGSKRLYELYHKLGTVEIQDQIDTAAQVVRSLWFIDPERVAIWGWSYGGYAAAMALAQSSKRNHDSISKDGEPTSAYPGSSSSRVFKCAASVAPVTNWIYYDTAYTERYMSSPWTNERYDDMDSDDHQDAVEVHHNPVEKSQDSPILAANKWTPLNETLNSTHIRPHLAQQLLGLLVGRSSIRAESSSHQSSKAMDLNDRYKKASLLEHAAHIEPDRYLLIHGTADDNVNFQQSIMLMKRLIKKNILFESRIYPDQDHGIAEKADKLHLGSTLSKFFIECLG